MRLKNNKGFTLLEIALVLVVFSIIIAGVMAMVGTAMQSQRQNRMSQQIVTILENVRSYSRRIDNSTINMVMDDFNSLSLLPADVTGSSNNYTDALDQPIDGCAAGGNNATQCGTGLRQAIAIVLKNTASADCGAILTKLASNTTDLGFIQFAINGATFAANANNLSIISVGSAAVCGAAPNVDVELDFSF